MKIGLYEAVEFLEKLGYTCIPLKGLKECFFETVEETKQTQKGGKTVYPSYEEAKKAAKKGEEPIYDNALKGFINE